MKVAKRILRSKKTWLALTVLAADAAAVVGFDVDAAQLQQGLGLWWNALGALLIASQATIDAVHGSPSDG